MADKGDDSGPAIESKRPRSSGPSGIQFADGQFLSPETARPITMERRSRLVLLVGPADSGKTTIVTSVYECLLLGPLGGFFFAGSATLPGFESRCHYSRLGGGSTSDTERTKTAYTPHLLHLRLRDRASRRDAVDLLLSDYSGELFERAKDSTSELRLLPLFERADRIVVLLDGKRLADRTRRQGAVQDVRHFLRRACDAGMLHSASSVEVLVSKDDLIVTSGSKAATLAFVLEAQRSLSSEFEPRFRTWRMLRVAARPDNGGIRRARHLDVLLASWIDDRPVASSISSGTRIAEYSREFHAFGSR